MRLGLPLAAAALLAGCAETTLRADDPRRAVVLAPYSRSIGLNSMSIPEGTVLYPAHVGGQAAWCSTAAVFFSLGERRAACFFDPKGGGEPEGWLKSAYIAGTLSSLRYDVDVPYRVTQQAPLPPRR
jgi:hypothetical protein